MAWQQRNCRPATRRSQSAVGSSARLDLARGAAAARPTSDDQRTSPKRRVATASREQGSGLEQGVVTRNARLAPHGPWPDEYYWDSLLSWAKKAGANKLNREYTSEFQKMQKKTTKMRHSLVCSFRVVLYSALMARAHTVVAGVGLGVPRPKTQERVSRILLYTLQYSKRAAGPGEMTSCNLRRAAAPREGVVAGTFMCARGFQVAGSLCEYCRGSRLV